MNYLKLVKKIMDRIADKPFDSRKLILSNEDNNNFDEIRVFYMGELADNGKKGITDKVYGIQALIDNNPVGYLEFRHYHNQPEIMEQHGLAGCLDVSNFNIDSNDPRIGELLYEKFGEIYNASFKGWPMLNCYVDDLSKSSYEKAVQSDGMPNLSASIKNKITKLAESDDVDLRGLKINDAGVFKTEDERGGKKDYHIIEATLDGEEVGELTFNVWYDEDYPERNEINVDNLFVNPKFRGFGVSIQIYKKFDQIYNSQFSGWKLYRLFTNPVAEYTFRKCVELGFVSAAMLQEPNISHDYDGEYREELWKDLRKKLPDNLKGEASMKDFRAITAGKEVDLRNLVIVYDGEVDDISADDYKEIAHEIYAQQDDEELGHLMFSEVENYPGELIDDEYKDVIFEKAVYIEDLVVYPKYKDFGVDLEMYKMFIQIYDQKFKGWEILTNENAKEVFKRAVMLGNFSISLDSGKDSKVDLRGQSNEPKK